MARGWGCEQRWGETSIFLFTNLSPKRNISFSEKKLAVPVTLSPIKKSQMFSHHLSVAIEIAKISFTVIKTSK